MGLASWASLFHRILLCMLTNVFPVLKLFKQRGKLVYYTIMFRSRSPNLQEFEGKENGHMWLSISVLFDFDSRALDLPINTRLDFPLNASIFS